MDPRKRDVRALLWQFPDLHNALRDQRFRMYPKRIEARRCGPDAAVRNNSTTNRGHKPRRVDGHSKPHRSE